MNTYFACLPCFLRQALEAARLASADEKTTEELLRRSLRRLSELPFDKTPPHIGMEIHRIVRDFVKPSDPYSELKARYNRKALDLVPRLKKIILSSADGFETAVRLSIAGNIIDFGHLNSEYDISLGDVVEDTLVRPFSINRLDALRRDMDRADRILYLTDNAGEIVFDRLLIEEIAGYRDRVVLGVRGTPVINDATIEDARQAGLTELVTVIENGSDAPGTILEECDKRFREEFERADLVIAKGQGNYETLSEQRGNIYFLLKVKCPAIALDLGRQTDDIVVTQTTPPRYEDGSRPLFTDPAETAGTAGPDLYL